MEIFLNAFRATAAVLLALGGGMAAVLLAAMAVGAAVLIAAGVFDLVTTAVSRRWRRQGKQPRSRFGRAIYGRDV